MVSVVWSWLERSGDTGTGRERCNCLGLSARMSSGRVVREMGDGYARPLEVRTVGRDRDRLLLMLFDLELDFGIYMGPWEGVTRCP